MALRHRHSEGIGKHLATMTADVLGKDGDAPTEREIVEYFLKVGLDNKGDFQSYRFARGSEKRLTLEVDLVALAAACAGVPVPSTPVFASVGSKVSLTNTRNRLVAAFVCPEHLTTRFRHLFTRGAGQILLLCMDGYRWESAVDFSAELGVEVKVPALPSFGTAKGEYGEDGPTVESGTYAELASFHVNASAKAAVDGHLGVSGERLYLSDTAPTFIHRHGFMQDLERHLSVILRFGSKKACVKDDVKTFLEEQDHGQARTLFQRLISGGEVSSAKLLRALHEVQEETRDDSLKAMCQHHIRSLEDFRAHDVLAAYNFVSLWGMKPEAGAGMSAGIQASVKAAAGGVAQAGAEAGVTVRGPAIETHLKFTRFRYQAAGLAKESLHPHHMTHHLPHQAHLPHSGIPGDLGRVPESDPSCGYVIMTQDTSITYGQMDLTLLEADASAEAGISQSVGSSERFRKGADTGKEAKRGLAIAAVSAEGHLGVDGASASAEASAGLRKMLHFMQYESAVAFWAPPEEAGIAEGETTSVDLGHGSGFSFGQSVEVNRFNHYLNRVLAHPEKKCGYMEALALRLHVTYEALLKFLLEHGNSGLVGDIAYLTKMDPETRAKYADHIPKPTAFLIESSFALHDPASVSLEAVWSRKSKWVLGPKTRGQSLRGTFIGKGRNPKDCGALQAIRLRYRMADDVSSSKTRFSLGIRYIAHAGIEYASVEEAGSEGIVNLATTWYGEFAHWSKAHHGSHGGTNAEQKAREQIVPQVILLHQ